MGAFIKTDWKSMYGDANEMIPPDAPVPSGKETDLRFLLVLILLVRNSQGVQGLDLLSTWTWR
jgi:hypothetical protein